MSWPFSDPGLVFEPYIGDYEWLTSVGDMFYAGFAASNKPPISAADLTDAALTDFPLGVVFQRNADFGGGNVLDLSGNVVSASIDPYLFTIQAVPAPGTLVLMESGLLMLLFWRGGLRIRPAWWD